MVCWLPAGALTSHGQGPTVFLSTLAHEIGHVLLGKGHPTTDDGVAPLPLTDHTKRLMYTGGIENVDPITHRRLLVKAEWDEAENWMKEFLDK